MIITIEERIKAIERVKSGMLMKKTVDKLNVGSLTISDWVKSKEKSSTLRNKVIEAVLIIKSGVYEAINKALFLWFIQERKKGIPISDLFFKEKQSFAINIGEQFKDFEASEDWLGKQKNRYGMRQLVIPGEKLLTDGQYLMLSLLFCKQSDFVNISRTKFCFRNRKIIF